MKAKLIKQLLFQLNEKFNTLKKEEQSMIASAAGETKSSAGDKHETARELIHQERQIISRNLLEIEKQINQLEQMQAIDNHNTALEGSLILTSLGFFFLGPALGFVNFNDNKVACVSIASPIGALLHGRKIGESFGFRGTTVKIQNIE